MDAARLWRCQRDDYLCTVQASCRSAWLRWQQADVHTSLSIDEVRVNLLATGELTCMIATLVNSAANTVMLVGILLIAGGLITLNRGRR